MEHGDRLARAATTAADPKRRPLKNAFAPCGDGFCLLDNAGLDEKSTQVVAIDDQSPDKAQLAAFRQRREPPDPDLLPRVFDLFYQGPNIADRVTHGLGIGLALVASLVELHGGSVAVSSDGPGTGSEFVVRLPTRAPDW